MVEILNCDELGNSKSISIQVEDALKKSDAQYRDLFDSMPNGFYISSHEGYYIDANPAFVKMLGYDSLDELKSVYIPTDIYVHESERKSFEKNSKFIDEVETYRLKKKDGRIIWLEDYARYIKDDDGTILYHQGICRDITDRKHAEEINQVLFEISNAVNTSQNLEDLYASIHKSLGRIIDLTNFHISLYDREQDSLTFVYWVDTVDRYPKNNQMFDVTAPHTQSHTAEVIMSGKPVLHTKAQFQDILRKRGVSPGFSISEIWLGVPLIIKDQVIGAMVAHSFTDPCLYTQQDAKILFSVSNQIAIAIEQKRTEDALKESENHFRLLIEQAPEAIVVYDVDHDRFVNANTSAEKLFGCSRNELLQSGPRRFYLSDYPDDQGVKESFSEYYKHARGQEKIKLERAVHRVDGSIILCEVHLVRLPTEQGCLLRISFIDLTQHKQAEKERIDAHKTAGEQSKLALVGQVAGKMAHDFNNILSIIMGITELTLIDCKEPETIKTLELICEQAIRGKNLTKNLVAFAKDQEPKQEFFRISRKIDLVINLLKKDLQGIEVIKEEKAGMIELLADSGMIEHGLVNLLQNSIHALSLTKDPKITIRNYQLDHTLHIEIEDNGCGIPEEHIKKIYDPSFTLKGSRDRTGSYKDGIKGTGYGMANVKKYITQHNGSISVLSTPGAGTKFTLKIPVIKKELTQIDKKVILEKSVHFEKSILLVEDEQSLADIQYRMLTQEPWCHKVDTAVTGQAAIDLFNRNGYDLISLDYVLPGGINGMDVYTHIRETNKTIPIVFISGNMEFIESTKEMKQKDPYLDYLSKPHKNVDYINCINSLMTNAAS